MAKDVVIAPTSTPAKVGRPTTYRPEYPQMMIDYFESAKLPTAAPATEWEPPTGKGSHKAALMQVYEFMPTFEGFGRKIQTSVQAMLEWRKRHPEFLAAYTRAQDIQREHFANGLITGAMNPTGAIFAAKNMVGWRDKMDIETTTSADTDGMDHLKAMMQVATPEELTVIASLFERLEQRSLPSGPQPGDNAST